MKIKQFQICLEVGNTYQKKGGCEEKSLISNNEQVEVVNQPEIDVEDQGNSAYSRNGIKVISFLLFKYV